MITINTANVLNIQVNVSGRFLFHIVPMYDVGENRFSQNDHLSYSPPPTCCLKLFARDRKSEESWLQWKVGLKTEGLNGLFRTDVELKAPQSV